MRATWLSSFITDTVYLAVGAWNSRFIGSPLQRAVALRRYGALASRYDADVLYQEGYLAPLEAALDSLPDPPLCALDISTGTGAAIGVVLRRFPECRGAAVDLSPAMLARAVARAGSEGWNACFGCADAAMLPFGAGTFDLVTVQNAFPVPGEIFRVLKPGGWMVMSYTAGGSVLPWVVRSLAGRLRDLGCDSVRTQQVLTGRYFMARRAGPAAVRADAPGN